MQSRTNFICLVVVLGIVLEDLRLFLVVKVADKIVEAEILSPFLTIYEPVFILAYAAYMGHWVVHLLGEVDVEFAGS